MENYVKYGKYRWRFSDMHWFFQVVFGTIAVFFSVMTVLGIVTVYMLTLTL